MLDEHETLGGRIREQAVRPLEEEAATRSEQATGVGYLRPKNDSTATTTTTRPTM